MDDEIEFEIQIITNTSIQTLISSTKLNKIIDGTKSMNQADPIYINIAVIIIIIVFLIFFTGMIFLVKKTFLNHKKNHNSNNEITMVILEATTKNAEATLRLSEAAYANAQSSLNISNFIQCRSNDQIINKLKLKKTYQSLAQIDEIDSSYKDIRKVHSFLSLNETMI